VSQNSIQSFEALGGHASNDTSYPMKLECWRGMGRDDRQVSTGWYRLLGIHRLVQIVRQVCTGWYRLLGRYSQVGTDC
jgi:hypothetical protein